MKCPGQDSRYWKPGAIFEAPCPTCGTEVEFFKDDTSRLCKGCGNRFMNPHMDFGCASYCRFAEQCVGSLPAEVLAGREDMLKDRVAVEMKRYFGRDFKRIGHAMRVARYAERIGREEQGNLAVILVAAYLHDIGLAGVAPTGPETDPRAHEEAGAAAARRMLERLGANEELIGEVCGIIGRHHRPGPGEGVEFKCVYDADMIANTEQRCKDDFETFGDRGGVNGATYFTGSGARLAREVLQGVTADRGVNKESEDMA